METSGAFLTGVGPPLFELTEEAMERQAAFSPPAVRKSVVSGNLGGDLGPLFRAPTAPSAASTEACFTLDQGSQIACRNRVPGVNR